MYRICSLSQASLEGSKGIWLDALKPTRVHNENKIDVKERTKSWFTFKIFGETVRKVPLAAYPNKAMLTIIQIKWYHNATEKTLVYET